MNRLEYINETLEILFKHYDSDNLNMISRNKTKYLLYDVFIDIVNSLPEEKQIRKLLIIFDEKNENDITVRDQTENSEFVKTLIDQKNRNKALAVIARIFKGFWKKHGDNLTSEEVKLLYNGCSRALNQPNLSEEILLDANKMVETPSEKKVTINDFKQKIDLVIDFILYHFKKEREPKDIFTRLAVLQNEDNKQGTDISQNLLNRDEAISNFKKKNETRSLLNLMATKAVAKTFKEKIQRRNITNNAGNKQKFEYDDNDECRRIIKPPSTTKINSSLWLDYDKSPMLKQQVSRKQFNEENEKTPSIELNSQRTGQVLTPRIGQFIIDEKKSNSCLEENYSAKKSSRLRKNIMIQKPDSSWNNSDKDLNKQFYSLSAKNKNDLKKFTKQRFKKFNFLFRKISIILITINFKGKSYKFQRSVVFKIFL